jgi:hypothetical protein
MRSKVVHLSTFLPTRNSLEGLVSKRPHPHPHRLVSPAPSKYVVPVKRANAASKDALDQDIWISDG